MDDFNFIILYLSKLLRLLFINIEEHHIYIYICILYGNNILKFKSIVDTHFANRQISNSQTPSEIPLRHTDYSRIIQ